MLIENLAEVAYSIQDQVVSVYNTIRKKTSAVTKESKIEQPKRWANLLKCVYLRSF